MTSLTSTLLWIVSYPDGARRFRSPGDAKTRVRHLPCDASLRRSLNNIYGDGYDKRVFHSLGDGFSRKSSYIVEGLAVVSSLGSTVYDDSLTVWPQGCKIMMDYLGSPVDVYSLRIVAFFPLRHPVEIYNKRDMKHATTGGVNPIMLSEPLFYPICGHDLEVEELGRPGHYFSVEDIIMASRTNIAVRSEIIGLLMPVPAALAIRHRIFRDIVLSLRWHRQLMFRERVNKVGRYLGPIRGWPFPEAAIWSAAGKHIIDAGPRVRPMDIGGFNHIADTIRKLNAQLENQDDPSLRRDAQTAVETLDHWAQEATALPNKPQISYIENSINNMDGQGAEVL